METWTRNRPNMGNHSVSVTIRKTNHMVIVEQHFKDESLEDTANLVLKQSEQIERCLNFGLDRLTDYIDQCAVTDQQIQTVVMPAERIGKKWWNWFIIGFAIAAGIVGTFYAFITISQWF